MKKLLLLVIALGSSGAWAEDKRPGYVSISTSVGSADYRDFGVNTKIGLDQSWRLGLGADRSRSGTSGNTISLKGGADFKASEFWDLRLQLVGSREPNDVSSFGFSPGFSWELSSLWEGTLATSLNFDFERNRYRQSLTGSRRSLNRAFVQQVFRASLSQELSENFAISLGFDKYRYNESAILLNQSVSSRRLAYGSLNSYIAGFPESAAEISLDWAIGESWAVSPHAGRAKSVIDGLVTKNYGLTVMKDLGETWSVSVDYTNSRPDQASRTDLFTLGVTYNL
jgi:hypothetical protein